MGIFNKKSDKDLLNEIMNRAPDSSKEIADIEDKINNYSLCLIFFGVIFVLTGIGTFLVGPEIHEMPWWMCIYFLVFGVAYFLIGRDLKSLRGFNKGIIAGYTLLIFFPLGTIAAIYGIMALEEYQKQKYAEWTLDGILIIFTKDFESKDTFIKSILMKMKVHGYSYRDWITNDTPMKILVNPKAQDFDTFVAQAMVQFRMMGIDFSSNRVEHATFEGTQGVSGTIVTHWS